MHKEEVNGIKVPVQSVPHVSKSFFQFVKPESVQVIGSYKAGCCLGPNLKVDVAVVMPKVSCVCFFENIHCGILNLKLTTVNAY